MIPSVDEAEVWTPKKLYKTSLRCHWENQYVIKSLRESWIWKKILVRIKNHWGKSDRNREYQDSDDSASTFKMSRQFSTIGKIKPKNKISAQLFNLLRILDSMYSLWSWLFVEAVGSVRDCCMHKKYISGLQPRDKAVMLDDNTIQWNHYLRPPRRTTLTRSIMLILV